MTEMLNVAAHGGRLIVFLTALMNCIAVFVMLRPARSRSRRLDISDGYVRDRIRKNGSALLSRANSLEHNPHPNSARSCASLDDIALFEVTIS